MTKATKCSPEVRERAVRMVQEHRGEYPSLWAAIELIAPKIGCVPQTLHEWVRKQEIDTGMREGTTSEERDRIEALGREVKELRRANEILNASLRSRQGLEADDARRHASRPLHRQAVDETHGAAWRSPWQGRAHHGPGQGGSLSFGQGPPPVQG